jgi:transposase
VIVVTDAIVAEVEIVAMRVGRPRETRASLAAFIPLHFMMPSVNVRHQLPTGVHQSVQQERSRVLCRLQGLLVTQGVRLRVAADFLQQVDGARLWDGSGIPLGLKHRIRFAWAQLALLNTQLEELEATRAALVPDRTTATGRYVEALPTLRGIGPIGAWVLATEIFGWREIRNRRELGALVGLVPAPYQSGDTDHDQGITRAGNKHVRRLMVQLAWSWVHYQPASALTRWYQRRFGSANGCGGLGLWRWRGSS